MRRILLMNFEKTPSEVCIHQKSRITTLLSHVDQTRVYRIKTEKSSNKKTMGKGLTFFGFISCYLPVTVVEDCANRLKALRPVDRPVCCCAPSDQI